MSSSLTTSNLRDIAITFEGKKVSVNQNKDGVILRVSVHPHDVPRRLWSDAIGTRYQVALVAIDDDEQPTAPDTTIRANRAIQSAGMLCRNPVFQRFMIDEGLLEDKDEITDAETADALRNVLGVQSRADFHEDDNAVKAFEELRDNFLNWRQKNSSGLKTERGV